jgi:serine/threonine protein kinase
MRERGPLSESDIRIIMNGLLEALEFCHSHYICHRDVKPANLVLTHPQDYNSIKLADFGVCAEDNGFSNIGGMTGTKPYMVCHHQV